MRVFQAAVMGSGGVGKSAITVRMVIGSFLEQYDPTRLVKQITVDGTPCLLEILDTAGIDQYLTLNDLFIRESEGFILVFSLAARDTFDEVVRTRESIMRIKNAYGGERIPIVIVGNKADLVEDREVDAEEGELLARKWGASYFETSARTDTNIVPVFDDAVRQMRLTDCRRRDRDPRRRQQRGRRCVIL